MNSAINSQYESMSASIGSCADTEGAFISKPIAHFPISNSQTETPIQAVAVYAAIDNQESENAELLNLSGIEIPENVIPIPSSEITYTDSANIIFKAMGEKRKYFIRDRIPHEIATDSEGKDYLTPISPERFCTLIELLGKRIVRCENGSGNSEGKYVWRTANFPMASAKILLKSNAAARWLPTIRQLANCPIYTASGEVLDKGYHEHAGGTYISHGEKPQDVPLEVAKKALIGLSSDFAFTTQADLARAIASFISPAMKMGGHITSDFPLDVAEADQSQSGKTFRQKLVAQLYAEAPAVITSSRGGVGSLDEAISTALIKGRPFINIGNFRGRLNSTIIEEAIRGSGRLQCRALKVCAEVDTRPFIWQLSTNGAELTRDLANRSIITRVRKQPDGYQFKTYSEGDLISHVKANQAFYLGAIFAVIREWMRQGSPVSDESRHDFREWCRAMDWIVQNIFDLPPLLDGHREEQARTANPALQWLRELCHAAKSSGMISIELTASQLASIAEDAGIEFPGNPASGEDSAKRIGKILGRLYRESDTSPVSVDGFIVTRSVRTTYGNGARENKIYTIEIGDSSQSTPSTP